MITLFLKNPPYAGILRYVRLYLFVLCLPLPAIAQQDFRPGYIITNSNDTVYGYLDYRGDIKNSKRCVFKKDLNAAPQIFLPFDIQAYRFTDSKFYVSKYVPAGKGEPEKALFVEYLVNGIIDLYFYRNANTNHYLLEKDGQLYELSNNNRIIEKNGTQYIQESKDYIGVLKAALRDCPSLYPEIDQADFGDRSLIKIAEDYHNQVCEGEKCIVYKKQLPRVRFRAGLFVGYEAVFPHFTEYGKNILSLMNFTTGQTIIPGIILTITLPRVNDRISFSAYSSYRKTSFHADYMAPPDIMTASYYETDLDLSTLNISGMFTYTFPRGKYRPVMALGISTNITLEQSGGMIREEERKGIVTTSRHSVEPFTTFYMGPSAMVGVRTEIFHKLPVYLHLSYEYLWGYDPVIDHVYFIYSRFQPLTLMAGFYF